MSLINQMLKDLETRREPTLGAGDTVLAGLNHVPNDTQGNQVIWIVGLLVLVLGAAFGGFNWYQSGAAPAIDSSAMQPVQENQMAAEVPNQVDPIVEDSEKTHVPKPEKLSDEKTNLEPTPMPPVFRLETRLANVPESTPVKLASARVEASKIIDKPIAREKRTVVNERSAEEPAVSQLEKTRVTESPKKLSERAYRKGLAALQSGKSFAAKTAFERSLNTWPEHLAARESLALIYINSGRVSRGVSLLEEGVKIDPSQASFRKLLARIHLGQGKIKQAIAVLEAVRLPVRTDTELAALKAALYQRAGDHRMAAGLYRQLVMTNESNGHWWMGLAISLESIGDIDNARNAFLRSQNSPDLSQNSRQYVQRRLQAIR